MRKTYETRRLLILMTRIIFTVRARAIRRFAIIWNLSKRKFRIYYYRIQAILKVNTFDKRITFVDFIEV